MVNPNITHHMLVSMALLICSHASQVLTVDKALAVGFTTLVLFDLCYFLDQENAEPNGGRASLGFSYAQLTMNKCKEFHKPCITEMVLSYVSTPTITKSPLLVNDRMHHTYMNRMLKLMMDGIVSQYMDISWMSYC